RHQVADRLRPAVRDGHRPDGQLGPGQFPDAGPLALEWGEDLLHHVFSWPPPRAERDAATDRPIRARGQFLAARRFVSILHIAAPAVAGAATRTSPPETLFRGSRFAVLSAPA